MRFKIKIIFALLVLMPLGAAGAANANPICGTTVPVGSTTVLTGNMDCRNSFTHGLRIATNPSIVTTIDCRGFSIIGPDIASPNGAQTGRFGIVVADANAYIHDCNISGYERGIRVKNSGFAQLINVSSTDNTRYGMDCTSRSSCWVTGGSFSLNGDEGMHFSESQGSVGGAVVMNNVAEGIYLLYVTSMALQANTLIQNGAADVYVKHSGPAGLYWNNWNISPSIKSQLHIVGSSHDIYMTNNVFKQCKASYLDGYWPWNITYEGLYNSFICTWSY